MKKSSFNIAFQTLAKKLCFTVFLLSVFLIPLHAQADNEGDPPRTPPPYVMQETTAPPAPEGLAETEYVAPQKPAPTITPANKNDPYRLNSGDHLRIYVFGVPDLTGEFEVDRKGMITMPLIGEIQAEGMNKIELQNTITQMLVQGQYFIDPKVTVEIIALQPFYILGEVNTPGSYPFAADLDVFKAIAIAGGYTPRAAKDKIIIIRKVHEDKVRIKADEDTPVLPGDSIKVEQRFF